MRWFGKNKEEVSVTPQEQEAIIEIETHKSAQKEAIEQAKQASQQLNKLLVENGFTLKIYVAAGGKHKGKTK